MGSGSISYAECPFRQIAGNVGYLADSLEPGTDAQSSDPARPA